MTNAPILPTATILFLLLGMLFPSGSKAQDARTAQPVVVLQVQGLTSATRDAITQELRNSTDLKLTYACVPSGLLVFSSNSAITKQTLRQRSLHVMSSRSVAGSISELEMGLAQTEALCAQNREQ